MKRQLEQQFEDHKAMRTQRLESLGTLSSGIAHDLNNALLPLYMETDLLKETGPKDLQVPLDTISTGLQRISDMVAQLLTFTRGSSEDHHSIHADSILTELDRLLSHSFPKDIRLEKKLDPDLGYLKGDSTQLHQVLLNLCVNARDAMPKGGTLRIEAKQLYWKKRQTPSGQRVQPGNYVRFSIIDTGTGMTPDVAEKIFDPFYTTKGPDEGTGLGLSTAHGIVNGHKGFITVESSINGGSCFHVHIPAVETEDNNTTIQTPKKLTKGSVKTILLVDDEASIRTTFTTVLRHLNYQVFVAENGDQAIDTFLQQEGGIDFVLTDIGVKN